MAGHLKTALVNAHTPVISGDILMNACPGIIKINKVGIQMNRKDIYDDFKMGKTYLVSIVYTKIFHHFKG